MMIEFIDDEFVQEAIKENERPLNELGEFVYTRTYSRWINGKGRREYWHETIQRAINYNMSLASDHLLSIGIRPNYPEMKKEAQNIFKNVYNAKQFPSGRTLWLGGGNDVINEKFTLGNFNCSFTNIEKWEDLCDVFYLLLVGRM